VNEDLAFAHELADLADSISVPRFRASDLVVETKPDMTPVTDVDRAVEQAIRDMITDLRPADGVVGEEFGADGPEVARWIVDPIDGTKNYVRGIPVWATLIALEREGQIQVGVISAPALAGRRWWASRGEGAYADRRRIGVSKVGRLEDAQFLFGGLKAWKKTGFLDDLLALALRCWRGRGFGDFWMHMLVAEGAAEIAAEPEVRPAGASPTSRAEPHPRAAAPFPRMGSCTRKLWRSSRVPGSDPTHDAEVRFGFGTLRGMSAERAGPGSEENRRATDAGIEIQPIYGPEDLEGFDAHRDLGIPGVPPFTRGVYPTMYRGRLWTMRQYAGMGTARETNARFRYLLDRGQTGLSIAFDLPTQMGYDSDHPRAEGEVGKTGVAINSIEDMRTLLADIPLDQVTTSMTINATAAILLLLYELVAEEQGVSSTAIGGTVQNDILKEYAARGTYIYPPKPSMRLVTDLFAYCRERIPRWNTISISGYHMREAGATAVQEVAFTLANAMAYVQAALDAGLAVDDFAPRLSFFFACHMNFFEEVAKFRVARRLWSRIMADRFGSRDPRSSMLRFHTQTGGATLTAQQPENNIVRTALEAMAAVLGGTQSLHTNSFDEALSLPTERAAKIALRTQQILGYESGVTDTVDPLGGSYYVEALTNEIELRSWQYIEKIDGMGGAVAAIEAGWIQDEIHEAAFRIQEQVEAGDRVVVGVNRYREEDEIPPEILQIDEPDVEAQKERVRELRRRRDGDLVDELLGQVKETALGSSNLLPPMKEALRSGATLGEVSTALREVFGEYHPSR
jgi:methylmalonyl-CoA mutase, N-terminal domain